MGAFLYGTALQWRLDIRSRTLLITCYAVSYTHQTLPTN